MVLLVIAGAVAGVIVGMSSGDGGEGRVEITDGDASARSGQPNQERPAGSPPEGPPPAASDDRPDPQTSPTLTPTTAAQDPSTLPRDGIIFGGEVKVRTGPGTAYGEVTSLVGREGSHIRITGPVEQGWFPVSLDGLRGYVYGGFIIDEADAGFALKARNSPPDVRDAHGRTFVVAAADRSGTKLYASGYKVHDGPTGDDWPVILADGRSGYIQGHDIEEAR